MADQFAEVDAVLRFDGMSGPGRRYDRTVSRDFFISGKEKITARLTKPANKTPYDGNDKTLRLILVRPRGDASGDIAFGYSVVASSPEHTGTSFSWDLDTTQYPDGQYALLTAHPDVHNDVLPIIIDNGGYRSDEPQYVALAPGPAPSGGANREYGWCWVRWPGYKPKIPIVKQKIRNQGPISGRPNRDQLYAQRMTWMYTTNDQPMEWRQDTEGRVQIAWHMQYFQSQIASKQDGLNRDGYPPEGSIHQPMGGVVRNGSLYVASMSGRIVRIDPDAKVTTVAGDRLKSDQPYIPGGDISVYERIGTFLDGPDGFDEPTDVHVEGDVLYVADSKNHRICKVENGEVTTVVGHKDGTRGYENGLSEPRGVTMRDGKMWIADMRNLRIVRADPVSGEIEWSFESVRPSGAPRTDEFPDWDGTQIIEAHKQHDTSTHRDRARFGVQGEAAFLYPCVLRFDSRGDLIFGTMQQFQIVRLVMAEERLEHVADFNKVPDFGPDIPHRAYPVLSVDTTGAFGEVDDIFAACWEHESDLWVDRAGNPAGFDNKNADASPGSGVYWYRHRQNYRRAYCWDGPLHHANGSGYIQTSVVGEDGSLWTGGVSGAGIHRITWFGDQDKPEIGAVQNGSSLWNTAPDRHTPTLDLMLGIHGQSVLGFETVDRMGQWPDADIADYLHRFRPDLDTTDVISFIRNEAMDGEVESTQPEPEEPEMNSVAMTGGMYHVLVGEEVVSNHYQFKEANQEALNQLLAGKSNVSITMDPITVEAD